jgi:hypothetical protein
VTASEVDSCPSTGTLGAFIEGRLEPERLSDVTGHVSTCATCQFVIEQVCESEQENESAGFRPATWQWIAGIAASAALVVIVYPHLRGSESPAAGAISRLAAAAPANERTIEPRLTGGFRWSRLHRLRDIDRKNEPLTPEQLLARGTAGSVLRQIGDDRSPQGLHAVGIAHLLVDDTGKAAALLQDAANAAPGDARVWSDLSAALFLQARDDPAALGRALAIAEHATRLDPSLSEAYFNRALILERMGEGAQAKAAWNEYLRHDDHTGWAAEAHDRLQDRQEGD